MNKLTIEEAERRHPDLIEGQVWRNHDFKYKYLCKIHGTYSQSFNGHDSGRGCRKCGILKFSGGRKTAKGLSRTPEYATVYNHFSNIFKPNSTMHKNYRGMPFFDAWNPNKGGSQLAGAEWIIKNLGKKPEGTSLHIIEHEKGFVPGNLEWTHPKKQSSQQMFKIIANLKHHIKELELEIRLLKAEAL